MNLAKHCELCDNQIVTLKEGTTCKLTNKKPEFNKTCFKINFGDKFEHKIKKINTELESIKRSKTDYYGSFVLYFLIGLAFIISGFLLGKYTFNNGAFSTVPIIIMGSGLLPLSYAFGFFNKYNNEVSIAKQKKTELDSILSLYNISYNIDLKFQKKIHGTQEVIAELKIKK